MPSPNFSAYTIQQGSISGPNIWKYDLYEWNLAPVGSPPPLIPRNEAGITESPESSYSGPFFNMDPYYGMTQKNKKLYGFAGENGSISSWQLPGQIFKTDQDWGGRTKTIYSGLTLTLPYDNHGWQPLVGGFAYDEANDCFTLLRCTNMQGVDMTMGGMGSWVYPAVGDLYLHTWSVSHPNATPQQPFYSGTTCFLNSGLGLAYRQSELYAVGYISGMTSGLTFQHINTNNGVNTVLSYCSAHVSYVINNQAGRNIPFGGRAWVGDLTYDEYDDKFYFLSYNGLAKIDPQTYNWEVVPQTASTQTTYVPNYNHKMFGFEIIEPVVTTTTTLCTEEYSIDVSPDFTNSTISLCDSDCTNCQIMYVSGCTAPHFGWCTASTTCFDLTLECCKTYCVEVLAPDGCSYTEYITAECPSTTTTTTYIPPEPTTTTTTTECVCIYPVEYFQGVLSGVTYPGDMLEGSYCNDVTSPYIYNHISNPSNSILTHGILIKQNPWGSLPISNNWWSLIRDIGANNYLLVGTGSTLTTIYDGIPPLANDFLVTDGQCECVTTTTTILGFTTTTTLPGQTTTTTTLPGQTTTTTTLPGQTTTTTTLDPCDFGTIPLTGDCPTTTTTTVPPTTTTTTPDPCDFGTIPLTGDCVTSTTTPDPYASTTTTTIPCCDECCLITGAWEIINTGTTGNNGFYSIHKTSPHTQTTLPIALKDPTMWGAIPHMFFQGFAKRTTNNFLYGAFLEHKIDDTCNGTSRYDLHIYQVNPNTGSGSLAQTYTGYDVCNNTSGIRTEELGEGCLGYDSLNDKLIFIPYNNTVHPVYQIQPWVNGSVTYLGDFTVFTSPPNPYAHMSGLSNVPGTNNFYTYLDECSFGPGNCNSSAGYVCIFDGTTLNANPIPGTINPLLNSSISAGLLYDCEDLYIVRQLPSCSGGTPQQFQHTWIDESLIISGQCAFTIPTPWSCAPGNIQGAAPLFGPIIGAESLKLSLNVLDKDGNFVSMDMLTGDTTNPLTLTVYDPFTNTNIGQWDYNIVMDGNFPGVPSCMPTTPSPCGEGTLQHQNCTGNRDWYQAGVAQCGQWPNSPAGNCANILYLENPANIGLGVMVGEPSQFEITLQFGGMGTPCQPEYAEIWKDGGMTTPGEIVTQGVFDVGTNGNLPGVGTFKDQVMGAEYMKVLMYDSAQSGQVFNGDNFTASTNNWNFTVRHPDGSGTIIGSWKYELVRYPTGPGFPVAICDATPPISAGAGGGRCRGGAAPCIAGAPALTPTPLMEHTYCFFFKNPIPAGSPIDLSDYAPGSSHGNDIEISWGENTCCSGATDNLVLTKYTLPSGPITNTILGSISGVTALAGLECAGSFCETPDNPCPTTTTTTVPVSTTTTTDPCAPSTTTSTTTLGPPTTTTTTPAPPTTTTTTLLVSCECECPPTPPSECPCIFSGTNFYVFYDGSGSFAVSVAQLANNVVLPWWQQFIQTLPGYTGCLYQATVPPPQQQSESWLRYSRYPWEGTNAFIPTPVGISVPQGVCGSGLDMPIAAALNDPNAVVISFVNETEPWYNDSPWLPVCNAPSGVGVITPPVPCTDWNTNQLNSINVTSGLQKITPTENYLRDFDSFMGTYYNGVWDQPTGTPGNNGSFNSFVYTLPVNDTQQERITQLNAYGAVEGRVVPAVDFVDIGAANNGGGLYNFDAIKQTNPYCADACFWNSGYGPGKTPDGRCVSGLTHFGFISVHSHEYLLSNWLGTTQANNIGIATLSATVCFHTACTSGITVEECCITGSTAEQWIVDNPGSVSGLAIGETFNDIDHKACYKVIVTPNPLPPNGITLNPLGLFGIDNCVECMANGDGEDPYCAPTTTTTTKIFRTTTTTSTTFRQIYGVERCCCPSADTRTYQPIMPEGTHYSKPKTTVTLGDYVNLNPLPNSTPLPTIPLNANANVDVTLHMFEDCPGDPSIPQLNGYPKFAPVWLDSQTGYVDSAYLGQDLAAVQEYSLNNQNFYNHLGSPNPGEVITVEMEWTVACPDSGIALGTFTNCIKYLGVYTWSYPNDPIFALGNCSNFGILMAIFCDYWIAYVGNRIWGPLSVNYDICPVGTATVLSTHNDCYSCDGGLAEIRTFHVFEECELFSFLPSPTSSPFPPGVGISAIDAPGTTSGLIDFMTAVGLDDMVTRGNYFYSWVGSPGVGQVVTLHSTLNGFNNDVLCLKYMGTVSSSAVPYYPVGNWWHFGVNGLSTGGTNNECCVCEDLQSLSMLQQVPQFIGDTRDIFGQITSPEKTKLITTAPTVLYYEPTNGGVNKVGWEDINVNGLAYLVKVWTKDGDQYVTKSDTTSCTYIDKKAFTPPTTTPTTTYAIPPTTTTTTYAIPPTTTTTTYTIPPITTTTTVFGQLTTTTTYAIPTTTTTTYAIPTTTTTTYAIPTTTTTTLFGQTTTTTTQQLASGGGPLSNFVRNDGTSVNALKIGDFINLYQDNAYGHQSIEILDIVDQVKYESGEARCLGQKLNISTDVGVVPLFSRFQNLESSLSQSPTLTTTTTITKSTAPVSHLFEVCWNEISDYIPNIASILGTVNKTWGIEYFGTPNYIGDACYDGVTNTSTVPSVDYLANNLDFYQYLGSPSVGETVRWCYWNDNITYTNGPSGLGPSRIPGMTCTCLRYMGQGTPDFYSNLVCTVTNSTNGTTCSDCDTNPNSGWGGSLTNKGITWDDTTTNMGLNSCCCNDDYPNGANCMPERINDTGCSGFTYTDLSAIPIGGTWYDATSGECFTHIADPGLTYFDFTAPVPNPGGPYIDCDACEQINEIICEPVTTTTTRPSEIWGLKPCCCEDDVIIGVVPNVGDVGQAGGFVFHVDTINNIIYEVAPKSTEIGGFGMRWGCWGTPVLPSPTLGTSIGMGKINTNEIIAAGCPDPTPWATYLDTLIYNGYDDWFAPSYNEWLKLWFNIGPGQALLSPLYNLADLDDLKPFSGSTDQPPIWITSSEHPANPVYDTIAIGLPTTWGTTMQVLQKNFLFMWLRPVRSYNYATCSGYTTTDLSTVPIGNTWFDPLSGQCYERIAYPGPTNYNVNVPLNGPYDDCECCEITHKIVDDCVTTTTTIWDPPKTTTTTTNRPTTTTTTRPHICYGIKPCCCLTGQTYSIGDTGPAGGVVFYHDGQGNYLEASPYDVNLSNYDLPQNIIAANATDSAHTFTMWGCMNLYVSGTSREIFAGSDNTSKINNACTPDIYGYPCCPSCTTDVNWARTNPCSGNTVPFTYDCKDKKADAGGGYLDCTKEYIGNSVWPNPGSNLDASNITLHSAAHICSTFSFSGYTDWYLPTIKEMNEMYNGLVGSTGGQTIGLENPLAAGPPNETFYSTYNFAEGGYYWTSSECDASRAEYFPMFNGFNNIHLSLGMSNGPNYPTGTPCSGRDSIFPELFSSELHSKSLIPYPDINNNIIQGSPKYIRPVRKFTTTNETCSGCTKTDLSFMPIGQVFYDVGTNMCYERIEIPGPDLYNISVVPSIFYQDCFSIGGCLDTHHIVCTTTTVPPTTTTTTAWSATTTTSTVPPTTTTTTCQGLSACCKTNNIVFARWCGDLTNPASGLTSYNAFYDTLTNECWETIGREQGPIISINYPPIPLYSCAACEIPCTTTTTTVCLPFALSACCEEYVFSLTADCNTILSYPNDQTDILVGQGLLGTINGVPGCYVVVPSEPSAPVVPAGFTYQFWCTNSVAAGDPPCICSGCTETNFSWSVPCPSTTTTTTKRCADCFCLSGVSHLEIFYTGTSTSVEDDVCLTSADGTYCLDEIQGGSAPDYIYVNQNNAPGIGHYQIVPFQYVNIPPLEIASWVVQWCDNINCVGGNNPYQIATASTIVNTSIPASNPAWDLGQTVWEYIDNQIGPISVNPRNVDKQDPCYNYSGTSHTGCCTTYGLLTCCYDPTNPYWGENLCCNKNQVYYNTVYDIPSLVSGTTGNPSIVPIDTIHTPCPNMCLTIVDEAIHTYEPVVGAPMLTLNNIDDVWTTDYPYACMICREMYQPCSCPTTTTTTVPPTTTTTTGPVTTTTTSSGPLGLENCCDPTLQFVAAGTLYTILAGMNLGDAFYSTIMPSDYTGCWKIINNPVGIIQTNMFAPSFVSSSCAELNTNTNYTLCCPVTTTTTIPVSTTTTTPSPTLGVRQCCPPYDEYIATGVILTWLNSNLILGDVVYGNIITAPFSLQEGCWEFVSNVSGPGVAVSITPVNIYSSLVYQDPCNICVLDEEAPCTTTTTIGGTIGVESCCMDPVTGAFDQYVALGAFEVYLNGLIVGQAFSTQLVDTTGLIIRGCFKVINNPIGLSVSTFTTPGIVYSDCYTLDQALPLGCCAPLPTTTTTTTQEVQYVKHCCTGDVYELVGDPGAVSGVAGLNNDDTFRLVVSGGQFDGMACCFHKCVGCAPIVGTISGTFLFPIWPAGLTDQCDTCEDKGQSVGCCPTTTTTTVNVTGRGLEECCSDTNGVFQQYVAIGTLLTDINGLSLGSSHLFIISGVPVCARIINSPTGPTVTGAVLLSPPAPTPCAGLQAWLPYQNQDPTLRIPCCPVTTTTTCTPI